MSIASLSQLGSVVKSQLSKNGSEAAMFVASAVVVTPLKLLSYNTAYKHQAGLSASDKKLLMTQEWARQFVSTGLWLGSLMVTWGASRHLMPQKSPLFHMIMANLSSSLIDAVARPFGTAALTQWLDSKTKRNFMKTGVPVMGAQNQVVVETRLLPSAQVAKSGFNGLGQNLNVYY